MGHDNENMWFALLTDACCPIISPKRFRHLFFQHHSSSIFAWKQAWWNPHFHKRGNLAKLPKDLWLPSSKTSPHVFKEANELEIMFIDKELERNKYAMFIRKVSPEFPDEILNHYIYEKTKDADLKLDVAMPFTMNYNTWLHYAAYMVLVYVVCMLLV